MDSVVVALTVRDLAPADLPWCGWSGSELHLGHVAGELRRAELGEVDYLAVCPPSGLPMAIGGVDHRAREGCGVLFQLAVHPALRSCGLGTLLVRAAEARIRERGTGRAELSVEENNPRARALYERLGYVAYGSEPAGWDELAPDGSVRRYETVCTVMRKDLA
ncbi:GNAT family N-acetyltransferase [Streptomyces sp. NPDC127098]|uniref:GNAT family N-acetyltransferase n=1 Tax=Streptomyces sp. NPDC127098 TaxID=3347137 RepID=UPI00364D851E